MFRHPEPNERSLFMRNSIENWNSKHRKIQWNRRKRFNFASKTTQIIQLRHVPWIQAVNTSNFEGYTSSLFKQARSKSKISNEKFSYYTVMVFGWGKWGTRPLPHAIKSVASTFLKNQLQSFSKNKLQQRIWLPHAARKRRQARNQRPATRGGQLGNCPPLKFQKRMCLLGTATSGIILPSPNISVGCGHDPQS